MLPLRILFFLVRERGRCLRVRVLVCFLSLVRSSARPPHLRSVCQFARLLRSSPSPPPALSLRFPLSQPPSRNLLPQPSLGLSGGVAPPTTPVAYFNPKPSTLRLPPQFSLLKLRNSRSALSGVLQCGSRRPMTSPKVSWNWKRCF